MSRMEKLSGTYFTGNGGSMSRMEKLRIMEIQVTKEIRHDKIK